MAKISAEANHIAYESGIAALAPVVQRILDLEAQVVALTARVEKLEKSGVPAHLRNIEKR